MKPIDDTTEERSKIFEEKINSFDISEEQKRMVIERKNPDPRKQKLINRRVKGPPVNVGILRAWGQSFIGSLLPKDIIGYNYRRRIRDDIYKVRSIYIGPYRRGVWFMLENNVEVYVKYHESYGFQEHHSDEYDPNAVIAANTPWTYKEDENEGYVHARDTNIDRVRDKALCEGDNQRFTSSGVPYFFKQTDDLKKVTCNKCIIIMEKGSYNREKYQECTTPLKGRQAPLIHQLPPDGTEPTTYGELNAYNPVTGKWNPDLIGPQQDPTRTEKHNAEH